MTSPRTGRKAARKSGTDPLTQALRRRDSRVMDMVHAAISNGDVMLAYQPVVQSADFSRIAYYEGFVRVLDETGRIIPARDFMPVVEEQESGRILDCLALEQGLAVLVKYPDLRIAVNMSARSVGYRPWSDVLDRALAGDPNLGERLILEITESSAMVVPDLVSGFMTDLRKKGISFALDDFGAGFTAFRHFRSFQFDILKIDGQFCRNIGQDPDNQVIVKAMLSMARQFDMFVIAEQVEAPEDAAYLASIGVDCLQGYHFGAPTVSPQWPTAQEGRRRA